MRRVSFTECALLTCDAPPHGGTVLLSDIDGDGFNELVVGTSQGRIAVFKNARGDGLPWAQGQLNPHLGTVALLKPGKFLGALEATVVAAVTVEGQVGVVRLISSGGSAAIENCSLFTPFAPATPILEALEHIKVNDPEGPCRPHPFSLMYIG
jgi:hypothetical protein